MSRFCGLFSWSNSSGHVNVGWIWRGKTEEKRKQITATTVAQTERRYDERLHLFIMTWQEGGKQITAGGLVYKGKYDSRGRWERTAPYGKNNMRGRSLFVPCQSPQIRRC